MEETLFGSFEILNGTCGMSFDMGTDVEPRMNIEYGTTNGIESALDLGDMTTNILSYISVPMNHKSVFGFPIMIIFCIRDSLREYKSNYVLLSSMKLSFYN
jgi:hypothetical protein